nr:hypothetical protein CFP56_07693 [Quercus suber]
MTCTSADQLEADRKWSYGAGDEVPLQRSVEIRTSSRHVFSCSSAGYLYSSQFRSMMILRDRTLLRFQIRHSILHQSCEVPQKLAWTVRTAQRLSWAEKAVQRHAAFAYSQDSTGAGAGLRLCPVSSRIPGGNRHDVGVGSLPCSMSKSNNKIQRLRHDASSRRADCSASPSNRYKPAPTLFITSSVNLSVHLRRPLAVFVHNSQSITVPKEAHVDL